MLLSTQARGREEDACARGTMGVFPTTNEGSREEKGREGESEVCWRIKVLVRADEWAKGD